MLALCGGYIWCNEWEEFHPWRFPACDHPSRQGRKEGMEHLRIELVTFMTFVGIYDIHIHGREALVLRSPRNRLVSFASGSGMQCYLKQVPSMSFPKSQARGTRGFFVLLWCARGLGG